VTNAIAARASLGSLRLAAGDMSFPRQSVSGKYPTIVMSDMFSPDYWHSHRPAANRAGFLQPDFVMRLSGTTRISCSTEIVN
jgi:hypothetical protein